MSDHNPQPEHFRAVMERAPHLGRSRPPAQRDLSPSDKRRPKPTSRRNMSGAALVLAALCAGLAKPAACQNQFSAAPQTPQGQAYDQLLSLINSYAAANQQQQQQQQAARWPNGLRGPLQPPGPATFAAGQQRRNNMGLVGSPMASSSPPTPYLTLSRLASLAGQQQQVAAGPQPQRPFMPSNSIPLGARPNPPAPQIPGRASRPVGAAPTPQFSRSPTVGLRPIAGGFAPSGPPPSQAVANNALVVVPSPPATAESTTTTSKSIEPTSELTSSESVTTEHDRAASSTSSTTSATSLQTDTTVGLQASSSAPGSTSPAEPLPTTTGSSTSSTSKELVWAPVDDKTNKTDARPNLAGSPDIVTVPPGYNPEASQTPPQSYDISVSAQMGVPPAPKTPGIPKSVSAAPSAVTTIIWSPPASAVAPTSTGVAVEPTQTSIEPTKVVASPTASATPSTSSAPPPSRVRDNSVLDSADKLEVVYGKAQARDTQPTAPTPVAAATIESSVPGRPFIQPVQMDGQVRPYTAGAQQAQAPFRASRPLGAGAGTGPMSVGSGFTIVANGNQTMPTADIQDYVAGEPTISASGALDPANFELGASASDSNVTGVVEVQTSSTSGPPPAPASRLRRPTFKPKPAVPPIRIDSCIVGDDTSCDQSHNERCVTEYGISSCHCKPGFARLSQLRGYCNPVSLLQLTLKIDKLSDDRRLAFNQTLENPNSEEYQYLEFESVQALAGAFQQTQLAKQFMGARVNKFFERRGKVHVNVSVSLELNNITRNERSIQTLAGQELARLVQQQLKPRPLGESTIVIDSSKESISRLTDVNECSSKELNDCSKFATCSNDFGGFHCQCLAGYEDKHSHDDKVKQGRVCIGCSPSYCSNRGECSIVEGAKQCKCRSNFIGARCDIDSEVLAVAVGGSLVGIVILVVTFWCLFVFNRRWKREQQKMDAMSATSGLTYNYVNSSTNSLMSPGRLGGIVAASTGGGGLHRSGGHHQAAAGYQHRFVNTGRSGGQHAHLYGAAPDQQAIMGSSSSASSAASCNQYGHLQASTGYQPAYGVHDETSGLLLAPASSGSSEQTSPGSGNSYRASHMLSQMGAAGNAYTLSGHHHHHHHHHQQQQQLQMMAAQQHHHHLSKGQVHQLSQFHADYRGTLSLAANMTNPNHTNTLHCGPPQTDTRWRTLKQDPSSSKQNAGLIGYYLVR